LITTTIILPIIIHRLIHTTAIVSRIELVCTGVKLGLAAGTRFRIFRLCRIVLILSVMYKSNEMAGMIPGNGNCKEIYNNY
jgi:hypothetical protein